MNVLLLGGSGLLGSALRAHCPTTVSLSAPAHAEVDVTDEAALVRTLDKQRPDVVILCAAYTAVDAAEREVDAAMRLNAQVPATLGRLATARKARVVMPSTDFVFDGPARRPWREEDPTAPRSVYGRSKREGERGLLLADPQALVLRTSWLFGRRGHCFPRTMWTRARSGQPARVVADQEGSPTFADDLADWMWQLVQRGARGIVHASNAGSTSWAEVAERVYARAGFPDGVTRVSSAEFGAPAPRPSYSVLDCTLLDGMLSAPRRPWHEALDECLDAFANEEAA